MIQGFEADPREWDEIQTIVRQEIQIDGEAEEPETFFRYMCGMWNLLTDPALRTRMLASQAHRVPTTLEVELAGIDAAKADVEQRILDRPADPGPPPPPRGVRP